MYLVETDKFKIPEEVNVSHILIKTGENHSDDEALAIAREVREKALNGDDFSALAEEFSEDASVKNNKGNLGSFTRGRMVKPFEEVAFSMDKAGEISEVFKTPFGYHIILFHAYQPARKQSFDEVKNSIIATMQQKKATQLQQDKMISLRSATDIQFNADVLKQLEGEHLNTISDSQ